ncbi:hypothetical protein [Biformimicrobium ophioploci]|uniref:Uncharacterized protein n=1 Tax=Biformimicrobium ophioploci TaxID=3036711 RepID=A0ABQ6LVN8_9GAMM|nr:hypothetical protein [Microbulbifer sp. NKW57]GMG86121.1 hypothetical protein MNKW57_04420 [Microbulbifer sp. NKW57]
MRASKWILFLLICVSSLSNAGEVTDKEKLKYIIDGWASGAWEPVVIRNRDENGWKTEIDSQAIVKKSGPYSLTFYEVSGEPSFKVDLSSGDYVASNYDKQKKAFGKASRASFVSADLNSPEDFTFLLLWEETSEGGAKQYSEGSRIGPFKSWSGFEIDSEGGRKYKFSNVFNAQEAKLASE